MTNFLVLAVEMGLADPMAAAKAQSRQRPGEPIADCLVREGLLTPEQVEEVRREQARRDDPVSIGPDAIRSVLGVGLEPEGEVEAAPSLTIVDTSSLEAAPRSRFDFICRIVRAIGAEVRLEAGIDRALRTLFDLFPGIQRAALYLRRHPDDPHWLAQPSFQFVERNLCPPGALEAVLARRLLEEGQAVNCLAVSQDTELRQEVTSRSILAAPLHQLHEGAYTEAQGILILDRVDPSDRPFFDRADLEAFTAVTVLLAAFVHRCSSLAAEIQVQLLPRSLPDPPGYQIAARYELCPGTGGDIFDLGQGAEACHLLLARVSGQGTRAALLTAQLVALFREFCARGACQALEAMHRAFLSLEPGPSATALVLEIPPTGPLAVYSCGHPAPFIRRRGIWAAHAPEQATPGLGHDRDPGGPHPVAYPIDLAPGDALLAYTGLCSEDVARLLAGAPDDAEEIVEHVPKALSEPPSSDLTLIALRRQG